MPASVEHGPASAPRDPAAPSLPRPPAAAAFLPHGTHWERLPEPLQRAAVEVIQPAYRRLVAQVADDMERAAGITLVHLLWLELCDQVELARMTGDPEGVMAVCGDLRSRIGEHLTLIGAKNNTAALLMRLRMYRQMIERGLWPAATGLAAPAALLPQPCCEEKGPSASQPCEEVALAACQPVFDTGRQAARATQQGELTALDDGASEPVASSSGEQRSIAPPSL